jgi:hypothetical protein
LGWKSIFLNSRLTQLHLLRALVHWALLSSDAIRQIIDDAYKLPQNSRAERQELDITSTLGVQPLFTIKGDNYYLVEGKDTRFRIYHETNPRHKITNFSSVAEDKPSLISLAEKLDEGGKLEKEFAQTIRETVIARIEAAEHRRIKAEQAALRLAMWKAATPVYNTRTRGKKVNYSELERDEFDEDDDEVSSRGRRTRDRADRQVVEYTASGRMVKRPKVDGVNGSLRESTRTTYGDEESEEEMEWSVYSDQGETDVEEEEEEGDDYEYDLGQRTLLVTLKIPKRAAAVKPMEDMIVVNGSSPAPQKVRAPTTPPKPQFSPQRSPSGYPATGPYRSPTQFTGPTPYGGAASPPLPFKSAQLSPQLIPRPIFPSPPAPMPYQTSTMWTHPSPPRSMQPQPYRPQNYAIAQFRPPSPPPSQVPQPLPRRQGTSIQESSLASSITNSNLLSTAQKSSISDIPAQNPLSTQKEASNTPGASSAEHFRSAFPTNHGGMQTTGSTASDIPPNALSYINGIKSHHPTNGKETSIAKEFRDSEIIKVDHPYQPTIPKMGSDTPKEQP